MDTVWNAVTSFLFAPDEQWKNDPVGTVVELRVGLPKISTELAAICGNDDWPDREYTSGYCKDILLGPLEVSLDEVPGNMSGYPPHTEDRLNRALLVFHEDTYDLLKDAFPESAKTLIRGGFAENIVVTSPQMLPSAVCIGDQYRIGTAVLYVSGPRFPCAKITAWHSNKDLKSFVKSRGWAGYFLRVVQTGVLQAGSDILLLCRPYPSYTVEKVSEVLWGPTASETSTACLKELMDMPELMECCFRETARLRYERRTQQDR